MTHRTAASALLDGNQGTQSDVLSGRGGAWAGHVSRNIPLWIREFGGSLLATVLSPKNYQLISSSNFTDFPGGSNSKESAYNAGDPGLIPGSGRSPGEGNSNPFQYSCLENPMDRGAWWAAVHGVGQRVGHDWATSLHHQNQNTMNSVVQQMNSLVKPKRNNHCNILRQHW